MLRETCKCPSTTVCARAAFENSMASVCGGTVFEGTFENSMASMCTRMFGIRKIRHERVPSVCAVFDITVPMYSTSTRGIGNIWHQCVRACAVFDIMAPMYGMCGIEDVCHQCVLVYAAFEIYGSLCARMPGA